MDRCRALILDIEADENGTLEKWDANVEKSMQVTLAFIFLGHFLSASLVLVSLIALRQDIEEKNQIEEMLRDTHDLQRGLLNSPNYLIISTDVDGKIRTYNKGAERLLGYYAPEVIEKEYFTFIFSRIELEEKAEALSKKTGKIVEGCFEYFVVATQNSGEVYSDWRCRKKDGTYFDMLLSFSPLTNSKGEIKGFIAIGSDITERKKWETELMRAREAAESASRVKSNFLANMSHELRTPLNSVIGFSNVMLKNKDHHLKPEEINYLERIIANGTHLLNLINSILDLSKIEAGKENLEFGYIQLGKLVKETVEGLEGRVLGTDVKLTFDIPEKMALFRTDPNKIKQILINLIGNSIKFTERGYVHIKIETDKITGMPVRIDVMDTGIGIPQDKLEKIFEAFNQADNDITRKYGGTGLGLTIARSLCDILGYQIEVRSKVGKGSTFSILLEDSRKTPTTPSVDSNRQNLIQASDYLRQLRDKANSLTSSQTPNNSN